MGTRGVTAVERSAAASSERLHKLTVLYDFEYDTKGKRVKIIKDETLLLVGKTNDDWWQVIRPDDLEGSFVPEQSTFYVPTGYIVQVDSLPDTTRFYVDKTKMFQQNAEPAITKEQQLQQSPNQQDASPQAKEEPRKALRSVIRKLSGNLGSQSDANRAAKPPKSAKIIKGLRKNSVEQDDGKPAHKSSLIPAKHKDSWESSAFGMCFGRDTKNVDATVLNPFQEELENKLSNRLSLRKTIIDTSKVDVDNKDTDKPVDQSSEDRDKAFEFETIHNKWEKVSAQVLKRADSSPKQDNFQYVPLSKIKEDAQKRRSASPSIKIETKASDINPGSASPDIKIETKSSDVSFEAKQSPVSDKSYSIVEKKHKKPVQLPEQKPECPIKSEDLAVSETSENAILEDPPSNKDIDRFLINDKRKMWAIETLMSELMQSSLNSKSVTSSDTNETGISGPNQLAQELHEMNASRRYEHAEIQVNLLDNKEDDTKENEMPPNADEKCNVDSYQKKVFDFSPRSTVIKAPLSPTARSPKLLDEYNEANILNDNERILEAKKGPVIIEYDEPPSYSNISLRIRREKVPCNLKMPTKDFREELQLTPSLEKLASEIRFLPASATSMEFDIDEKSSPDLDCPSTTLSQDSLRLYKRRSKSDGALNRGDQPLLRRDNSDCSKKNYHPATSSHADISIPLKDAYQQHSAERKRFAYRVEPESNYLRLGHSSSGGGSSSSRYRLNRKSRSLGDLDCSELDEPKEAEPEARRRYKPVPKLRSKESLRRIKPIVAMTASSERLPTSRPIPAKRRIHHQQQQHHQREQCDGAGSLDELREIDIERSTAVGFKSLLCSPDSGSEECLQYKTFPAPRNSFSHHQQKHQQQQKLKLNESSRSESSVNSSAMSRSLSDEAILSSTSCSSAASPSRLLDGSVENLVELPPGWTQTYDSIAKRVCFVNERGDKWFSSNDSEGKIYFFEENSNESSWALPSASSEGRARTMSNGDWPQLFDGNMCILKEGTINKTKITTENGKKLRKAWSSSYAVLTELFLLFFKDAKTFAAMKMDQSAAAKPDISVDLNGAFIEPADKLSNRKNVYLINTLLGLQVLVQSDNALVIAEWYKEIHDAIQRLPYSQECGRFSSSRE
ncbi:hypothetical protein QAD02_012019 [Eretmocerus hayati]|uniref:Uncharacterized protein n=1 Tax=Eretmocerus hayati TaxID=131215 RepID=A0ACC2NZC6_9HYME|nr:hypothetical protein QAD02_012019 [Eretmocerus hayati]